MTQPTIPQKIQPIIKHPPDIDWTETLIHCPVCGFNYQHADGVTEVDGGDMYEAGWGGRGDLIRIPFWGECGHTWDLCLGFHKGDTFLFVANFGQVQWHEVQE